MINEPVSSLQGYRTSRMVNITVHMRIPEPANMDYEFSVCDSRTHRIRLASGGPARIRTYLVEFRGFGELRTVSGGSGGTQPK